MRSLAAKAPAEFACAGAPSKGIRLAWLRRAALLAALARWPNLELSGGRLAQRAGPVAAAPAPAPSSSFQLGSAVAARAAELARVYSLESSARRANKRAVWRSRRKLASSASLTARPASWSSSPESSSSSSAASLLPAPSSCFARLRFSISR